MHSGPPPFFFHDGILQGSLGNSFDRIHHSFREALPEFRANARVSRQCFFQFGIGFRQPDNRQRHCFLDRPARTCSQVITSEGFCSYLATR